MFEQDYIMCQIRQILKVLVKILFNIDDESLSSALIQDMKTRETADDLLRKINSGTMNNLLGGFVFYSYLNGKDDYYLEINDFSRDKVETGIKHLLSEYGLETMSDIFFYN